LNKSLNNRPI